MSLEQRAGIQVAFSSGIAPYYNDHGLGQEEGHSQVKLEALVLHGSTALQMFASRHEVPALSLEWLCSRQGSTNIHTSELVADKYTLSQAKSFQKLLVLKTSAYCDELWCVCG